MKGKVALILLIFTAADLGCRKSHSSSIVPPVKIVDTPSGFMPSICRMHTWSGYYFKINYYYPNERILYQDSNVKFQIVPIDDSTIAIGGELVSGVDNYLIMHYAGNIRSTKSLAFSSARNDRNYYDSV